MDILAGNRRVCERVSLMLADGRFPHAVMLEGDEGTGKHTLAGYIAAYAVCTENNRPCGECKGCHMQKSGSHPDIITVSPDAKQLSVDKIRKMRADAYLAPAVANKKIYIIEKAETMNAAAQNALLKVLEEPPANVMFLLLTLSAESMLETVRSRCITLTLLPPDRQQAAEYLSAVTPNTALEIDRALETAKNNIGVALKVLKEEQKNTYTALAAQLLADINTASAYSMLCRLKTGVRDRAALCTLLDELMLRISALLREGCYTHIKECLSREQLVKLYETTRTLKAAADANANVMLLLANLCSEYKSVL